MAAPHDKQDDTLPPVASPQEALDFALALGIALHRYGAPAHRLEAALVQILARVGVAAQFFAVPTALFASLSGQEPMTRLVRVEPGELNLERQAKLDALVGLVARGELGLPAAVGEVGVIMAEPARYGALASVLAFGAASAVAAVFFGGGLAELAVSALLGLLVGLLVLPGARNLGWSRFSETLCAFVVALLANVAASHLPLAAPVVMLSALIVLMPGLTLTIALTELSTRNLVCGTTRMAGAMLSFVQLGLGAALGARLSGLIGLNPPHLLAPPLPAGVDLAALPLAAVAYMVLLRAAPRQLGLIFAGVIVAFLSARGGALLFGPQLGTFVGALGAGLLANASARSPGRPAAVPLLPGILVLVPGGIGFRGVTSLVHGDVVSGVETAFSALLVAVALAAGLLLSNLVLPPRREL